MEEEGNFNHPRMADYLKPDDLNLDGCISLATAVLAGAADEYVQTARQRKAEPWNQSVQSHYKACRKFYLSDYFKAMSGGVTDGKTVLELLDRRV